MRIRHPSQLRATVTKKASNIVSEKPVRYGGTGRQSLKKMAPPMVIPSDKDAHFTYGAPLRPATPIKAVIGNFYGEIAGYGNRMKASDLRFSDERFRREMLNPPKSHTRASAMANTHVNSSTMIATLAKEETKSLFKMKKFMAVEPRTSSKNPAYKATRRDMTNIATRPNPI